MTLHVLGDVEGTVYDAEYDGITEGRGDAPDCTDNGSGGVVGIVRMVCGT